MALISADEFRERFDIDSEIANTRIEPHIGSASRRLRGWVGATNYAAAGLGLDHEDADVDLINDLKNAEAHLAFHFAILGFNSPLSGKGVVATSMTSEGKEMRKYLTPRETNDLAGQYLQLAAEIAGDYMTAVDAAVPVVNEDVEDIFWPEV